MPYCPVCYNDYVESVKTCPDCNVDLVQGELKHCENCDELLLDESSQFCSYCGVLISDMKCSYHNNESAVAVCIICEKPLCKKCANKKNGRYFCADDKNVEVHENLAVLITLNYEYQAQMLKDTLVASDIEAHIFSQKDRSFMLSVGEQSYVKVMVPKEKLFEARNLLKEIMDSETQIDESSIEA